MIHIRNILVLCGLLEPVNRVRYTFFSYVTRQYLLKYLPLHDRQKFLHTSDPVRYGAIQLAMKNIYKEDIKGAIAEVGVYRGETSKFLRKMAPDRDLYLFDTFEGFHHHDLNGSVDTRFRDTSLKVVKRAIGDLSRVHFRVGYFPETAIGLEEEQFAFVMVDVDLYKPTIAALNFFYERLTPGGYIFVHDYNSPESDWAISEAVTAFINTVPEGHVEIPDACGSIIIRKNS